ncbi:MAG: hypothetical protein JO316_09960 [Abitibacteriaceae bacterium]|nr:hypothetical protein [Abditibacteriaceae bacterium]
MATCCPTFAQVSVEPDTPVAPQELTMRLGEIQLEGQIRAVDPVQKTLTLDVTSFTLPSGKANQLAATKPKVVLLDEHTLLHVRGGLKQSVTLADLTALGDGIFAAVVGKDLGSDKALPAREVAVWDRIEAGLYRFKDKAAPDNQGGGDASEANPADADDDALDEPATPPMSNIFPYGSFEEVDEQGTPAGWAFSDHEHMKVMEEGGNHFLRIISPAGLDGKITIFLSVPVRFKLNPSWQKIRIYARMRATQLHLGSNSWETARLVPEFQDAGGNRVGPYQPVIELKKDSDWVSQMIEIEVVPGATYLRLSAESFASGIIDYDDIRVEPNSPLPAHRWRKSFPEGNFETPDAQGNLLGWKPSDPKLYQVMEENGNHFLRINNLPNATGQFSHFVSAPCRFKLDPHWKKLRIRVRMRASHLKIGVNPWEDARLALVFEDALGRHIEPWTAVPSIKHDTDWVNLEQMQDITPGSVYLTLSPEMQGSSGVVDYDDIRFDPIG